MRPKPRAIPRYSRSSRWEKRRALSGSSSPPWAYREEPSSSSPLACCLLQPLALRIFLRQLVDGGEHGRFVFRRALELREREQPLGIHFGIGSVQRCQQGQ